MRSDKISARFQESSNAIRGMQMRMKLGIPKRGRLKMSESINQFIVVIIFVVVLGESETESG